MALETGQPNKGQVSQNPEAGVPSDPPQKIGLLWVLLGIGAILLMWFVSHKVF